MTSKNIISILFSLLLSILIIQDSICNSNLFLDGTLIPNASFLGLQKIERVGYALSCAGDVNGDGFDDFLIGTFHNATMGFDAGAAYLILGRETVDWGMKDSLTHADARFLGGRRYEAAGFWIAEGGDVNGDGFSDIVIGAPAGNDEVSTRPGKMYVVFGRKAADWGYQFLLSERADLTFDGENGQDLAGRAVETIGDLNGDGCDEILCAAPYNDYGNEDAGKIYLITGRREGWSKTGKLVEIASAIFYSKLLKGTAGYSIARLGDVNGDGITDFGIGAPGASRVFIMFGRKSIDWGKNFNLQNADLTVRHENIYDRSDLGWMVAGAGDVNGDQISDILISDIEENPSGNGAGKIHLIFGRAGGWNSSEFIITQADASYIGEKKGDQAGWDVGGAGDVNGDGYDDFLIGAWKNNSGYPEAGEAYLIYGKPAGWERNINLATIPTFFSGVSDTNFAGYNVNTAGDLDGDGWGDFIISAPYNSQVAQWSGQVYLFASQRQRYMISGNVSYHESQHPISHSLITIHGDESSVDTTDSNGSYQFEVFGLTDYSIFPFKNNDEDIGDDCISAYDAALAARQSVNLESLTGMSFISADVNLNGRVTTYDAALILQYAVGSPPIHDSHVGEWLFSPDSILITNLSADQNAQDFSAIIRGDVDASWNPQQLIVNQNIHFTTVENLFTIDQEKIIIPIRFESNQQIISFDVKVRFDPAHVKFINVEKCEPAENFQIAYYATKAGVLKVGGYSINPVNQGGNFINLIFNGSDKGDQIHLEKLIINDGQVSSFVNQSDRDPNFTFQLFQNYPNPFNGMTEINYQISRPGKVIFSIFNTLGQEVFQLVQEKELPGSYSMSWNGVDNLGRQVTTGIYICYAAMDNIKRQIKLLYLK